ncbi:hypothetical protein PCASD_01464 [Puccinia coronata f. sp. avenae]|uniref:RNase H type-1 domain-containing protein n=1 Tax=Puccinia coronata f. sp. avenae TaxID=200324 RepID=A0A2N5VKA4_9BASI|nr:hypothetical protein PCASD_01464 [Puccinia coronata f. sp. avenae]
MEWINYAALRTVPEEMIEDLRWWDQSSASFNNTKLIPDPDPTDVGRYGDASTGYGLGVLIGKHWSQFQIHPSKPPPDPRCRNIAWLETVAVRLGLLTLIKIGAQRGEAFIVRTDNTTTLSTVSTRKSNNHNGNEEWKLIQHILLKEEIDL